MPIGTLMNNPPDRKHNGVKFKLREMNSALRPKIRFLQARQSLVRQRAVSGFEPHSRCAVSFTLLVSAEIAVSRINYLHGNYRTIRPNHLERIVQAVARNANERSELVRAYLLVPSS